MTPYRSSELPPKKGEPSRELVYRPRTKEGRAAPARSYGWYALVILPAALLLSFVVHGGVALAFVVLVVAYGLWGRRRGPSSQIRIRVEGSTLTFHRAGRGGVVRDVPLAKLRDVRLDTRTVSQANSVVRPDGVLASGALFAVDESRVTFIVDGAEPVHLTDAYQLHTDSLEWLGKIRMFLRNLGWVPEDEREASSR